MSVILYNNTGPRISNEMISKRTPIYKKQDSDNVIHEEKKESIEMDAFKQFEYNVLNRKLVDAMSIIENNCTKIDFNKHYFKNGDTCISYAVRLHNAHFLIYLLQKGYNVCLFNILYR